MKIDVKSLEPEKVELAKQEQRQVDFLEGVDLERILEAPLKIDLPDIIRKRDKAILELFFSTGLRVSELCKLKIESINLKKMSSRCAAKAPNCGWCFYPMRLGAGWKII